VLVQAMYAYVVVVVVVVVIWLHLLSTTALLGAEC